VRALFIAERIGQRRETVAARYQMSIRSMWDAIDGNASNTSILLSRYGMTCKAAVENVEAARPLAGKSR